MMMWYLLIGMILHVHCVRLMCCIVCVFVFFKQKTAYEVRISDWSSDVCSSDLDGRGGRRPLGRLLRGDDRDGRAGLGAPPVRRQIGRASCRERVCQYV